MHAMAMSTIGMKVRARSSVEFSRLITRIGEARWILQGHVRLEQADVRQAVRGRMYIDCSGDGDLAHWAGVAMEKGDDHGHLTALDLVTGETRWQRNHDCETFGNPIADGDSVFMVSPQRILRFALADGSDGPAIAMGREPWSGPPARVGKRLLVPAQDGTIHVIDLATAAPIYSLEGHKRGVHILPMGAQVAVALPDRRFLFFAQLR